MQDVTNKAINIAQILVVPEWCWQWCIWMVECRGNRQAVTPVFPSPSQEMLLHST